MKEITNEIICRHSSVSKSDLNDDLSLTTSVGITSFEFISSIYEIEETFHIHIPDQILGSFHTLGDLYRYIEAHSEKGSD